MTKDPGSTTPPLDSEQAIESLTRRMIERTLPKREWTHAGHFAAALWLLRHRPDLATPDSMRRLIRAYNEAVGGENTDQAGYHHTITIASLRAASAHLAQAGPSAPLPAVLARVMASDHGRSDWLLSHWSRDRLFAAEARRMWVDPDLAPLPF